MVPQKLSGENAGFLGFPEQSSGLCRAWMSGFNISILPRLVLTSSLSRGGYPVVTRYPASLLLSWPSPQRTRISSKKKAPPSLMCSFSCVLTSINSIPIYMTSPSTYLEVILDLFLTIHINNLWVSSLNYIFFLHPSLPPPHTHPLSSFETPSPLTATA